MDRRGFLGSILALGVAPAIVRPASLMKIVIPTTEEVFELTDYSIFSEEMATIIRRAFIPRMVAQIYNNGPLTRSLLISSDETADRIIRMGEPDFVDFTWDQ